MPLLAGACFHPVPRILSHPSCEMKQLISLTALKMPDWYCFIFLPVLHNLQANAWTTCFCLLPDIVCLSAWGPFESSDVSPPIGLACKFHILPYEYWWWTLRILASITSLSIDYSLNVSSQMFILVYVLFDRIPVIRYLKSMRISNTPSHRCTFTGF